MLELVTDTRVDLAQGALRFGAGLFETIRVQGGRARWLPLHLERLAAGCAFLGLDPPPPDLEARLALPREGVLRLLAADGRLLAWTGPLTPAPGAGLRIGLARGILRHPGPLTRFKTTSYLENHLLQAEARARNLDEVLAPTPSGRLSDGGRSTLVAHLDGALLTPPLEDGALPGVGRRVLLEAGLVREAPLAWEDLARARSLGLVSALRGVRIVDRAEGLDFRPSPDALREAADALSW